MVEGEDETGLSEFIPISDDATRIALSYLSQDEELKFNPGVLDIKNKNKSFREHLLIDRKSPVKLLTLLKNGHLNKKFPRLKTLFIQFVNPLYLYTPTQSELILPKNLKILYLISYDNREIKDDYELPDSLEKLFISVGKDNLNKIKVKYPKVDVQSYWVF
jgi:hypothetical protein